MPQSPEALSRRYVAWLRRHVVAVIVGHLAVLGLAGYLIAFKLPLYADFSYLLPQDAPAVKDLRRLEARVQTTDVVLVLVEATTPAERAAATHDMATALKTAPADLVERVDEDDSELVDFVRANK